MLVCEIFGTVRGASQYMRHSLHSHIIYLEKTIQDLKNRLTSLRLSPDEVLDLELQLTLAESALKYYREAYTLELSISGSEPSGDAGSKTGSFDTAKDPKREKNEEGRAGIEGRDRNRVARPPRTVTASRLLQIEISKRRGGASK
jgi:hypothetical protein